MKRAATHVWLCLFNASPAAAGDMLMSVSFCSGDDATRAFYLQGVGDLVWRAFRRAMPCR